MLEKRKQWETEKKTPRYWHQSYAEPVAKEDLGNWSTVDYIEYIGDYTDKEWKEFKESCRRNSDGEPIINGKKIDKEGNVLEEANE